MKNKFVLGIFFFLILMTSSVFGSMVENSRQGSPAISAEMHPESTHREPGMALGLELRFLGFCVRSGIIYTDPFGLAEVLVWGQHLRFEYMYSDYEFFIGQKMGNKVAGLTTVGNTIVKLLYEYQVDSSEGLIYEVADGDLKAVEKDGLSAAKCSDVSKPKRTLDLRKYLQLMTLVWPGSENNIPPEFQGSSGAQGKKTYWRPTRLQGISGNLIENQAPQYFKQDYPVVKP